MTGQFQAAVLSPQHRLRFDIGSLTKADPQAHYAALLRGQQGGWLSPNDCRVETSWPTVPGGDNISPPNTSAAAAGNDSQSNCRSPMTQQGREH